MTCDAPVHKMFWQVDLIGLTYCYLVPQISKRDILRETGLNFRDKRRLPQPCFL